MTPLTAVANPRRTQISQPPTPHKPKDRPLAAESTKAEDAAVPRDQLPIAG